MWDGSNQIKTNAKQSDITEWFVSILGQGVRGIRNARYVLIRGAGTVKKPLPESPPRSGDHQAGRHVAGRNYLLKNQPTRGKSQHRGGELMLKAGAGEGGGRLSCPGQHTANLRSAERRGEKGFRAGLGCLIKALTTRLRIRGLFIICN